MTAKKSTKTEADKPVELTDDEMEKARGGGTIFSPAGGAKPKKRADKAGPDAPTDQSIIHEIASGADLG